MIDRDPPPTALAVEVADSTVLDRLGERVHTRRGDRRLDTAGDAPVQRREPPQVDRLDPAVPEDHEGLR